MRVVLISAVLLKDSAWIAEQGEVSNLLGQLSLFRFGGSMTDVLSLRPTFSLTLIFHDLYYYFIAKVRDIPFLCFEARIVRGCRFRWSESSL